MRVVVCPDAEALGQAVAAEAARLLRAAVQERGSARLLLSTGKSQFTTLAALVREPVPWQSVEAFHLDEYIGLSPDHPASFRRYLRERFASQVDLRRMHYVAPEGDLLEAWPVSRQRSAAPPSTSPWSAWAKTATSPSTTRLRISPPKTPTSS